MIIKIANNCYQMPRKQAKGLLKIARDQITQGIYAVEAVGKGYIELTRMELSPDTINKMRKEFGKKGLKIYAKY